MRCMLVLIYGYNRTVYYSRARIFQKLMLLLLLLLLVVLGAVVLGVYASIGSVAANKIDKTETIHHHYENSCRTKYTYYFLLTRFQFRKKKQFT